MQSPSLPLKKIFINRCLGLLPGLPILGLVVVARLLGLFQSLELQLLDFGLRSRPNELDDQRITIVTLTEETIQTVGQYPLPDAVLVELLQKINQHQPRVIGLDILRDLPIEPGHDEFLAHVKTFDNLIVANKILDPAIAAPVTAPEDRIGFVDTLLDKDGFVRRSLLGSTDTQNNYRFSFTIRLAEHYLAADDFSLENGLRNPSAMRFGQTELIPFQPNVGGYIRTDAGGNQILINFRKGPEPFNLVTYQDVISGSATADLLEDKIVLIGVTAPSVKDIVNAAAIDGVNPGLVTGIELQAHAISQIVSAVLDGRAFLQAWPDGIEYLWIVGWGLLGIAIAQLKIKPTYYFINILALSVGLLLLSYSLLLVSWWIPLIPTAAAFLLNGLVWYPFFRTQHDLQLRIDERQQLIERTFDQIHNGPLQKMAMLLVRTADDPAVPPIVHQDLNLINQELRSIYESMQQEFWLADSCLRLAGDHLVQLTQPLHEMLYEVYEYTLARSEFPCFTTIKLHLRKFEPMADQSLSLDRKRELGRFLEEALCNVGKYAKDCSRLTVICVQEKTHNVIRVTDNGLASVKGPGPLRIGRGTQQAAVLARRLGGYYERPLCEPHGFCSELRWPAR